MKELSIEEKAKAYDEALKVAVAAHKDEDKHLKATLERIFPELKESEDEKVRKAIKYCIMQGFIGHGYIDNVTVDDCLTWLEKQGTTAKLSNPLVLSNSSNNGNNNQETVDKVETRFHEGNDRPVTERIKTFEDACEVLGDEHPFVTQYRFTAAAYKDVPMTEDFIAYLKLRIIVAALNEGWEPKFEKCEYRYYPWFYLYTKEQYDELDDEKKGRCVLRSGNNTFSYYGVVYCFANVDASSSFTVNSSRLALRSHELAEYAGKQFIEEWVDFIFKSE